MLLPPGLGAYEKQSITEASYTKYYLSPLQPFDSIRSILFAGRKQLSSSTIFISIVIKDNLLCCMFASDLLNKLVSYKKSQNQALLVYLNQANQPKINLPEFKAALDKFFFCDVTFLQSLLNFNDLLFYYIIKASFF